MSYWNFLLGQFRSFLQQTLKFLILVLDFTFKLLHLCFQHLAQVSGAHSGALDAV